MAIKVRSRWRLLALTMGLLLLALMVPAQAARPPQLVEGNSNCASVGSPGKYALTLNGPISGGNQPGTLEGAVINLTAVINSPTKTKVPGFDFTITGGVVYDVIVKGSGANLYSYEDGTVADTGLQIPNGNKLSTVHFCYTPGVPLACGDTVTTPVDSTPTSTDPTGSFTLNRTGCSGIKVVDIEIRNNNTIVFIPQGGSSESTYQGTITFTKDASDDTVVQLWYDGLDDGVEAFVQAKDCTAGLPSLADPWCVVSAEATHIQNSTKWTVTWTVKGIGDPLFK